jgi:hypothetical protein
MLYMAVQGKVFEIENLCTVADEEEEVYKVKQSLRHRTTAAPPQKKTTVKTTY